MLRSSDGTLSFHGHDPLTWSWRVLDRANESLATGLGGSVTFMKCSLGFQVSDHEALRCSEETCDVSSHARFTSPSGHVQPASAHPWWTEVLSGFLTLIVNHSRASESPTSIPSPFRGDRQISSALKPQCERSELGRFARTLPQNTHAHATQLPMSTCRQVGQ